MYAKLTEQALGVIRSTGVSHWVIITPTKFFARRGTNLGRYVEVYLGPGTKATEEDRQYAQKAIEAFNTQKLYLLDRLRKDKEFVIPRESIIKIVLKLPGLLTGGSVQIKTLSGAQTVKLSSHSSRIGIRMRYVIAALVPSLVAFADDRFYDEKTGRLVSGMVREGWKIDGAFGWKLKS